VIITVTGVFFLFDIESANIFRFLFVKNIDAMNIESFIAAGTVPASM
jgi:hypothetical protein